MHNGIKRINTIFEQVATNTLDNDTLMLYAAEISSLNLSDEYSDLKDLCVKKIENREKYNDYREAYKNNPTAEIYSQMQKLTKEYNDINLTDAIMEAFDKADVEYTINNGAISYSYKR